MAEFGEKLRKAREEKGITQQTLAEKVFVTRQTISRYETGERYPDIIILKQLASVLEVSTDYLLGDEEIVQVVEKNPIIEKPILNNMVIFLYSIIVFAYTIFLINQLPMSSFIEETIQNGGSYLWVVLALQILTICLFIYGLITVLKGSMNAKKTGCIMIMFFLLEGAKNLYNFVRGSIGISTIIMVLALVIISIYVFGMWCTYLFFIRKQWLKVSFGGLIGVSCLGIYSQIIQAYRILMYADHMYSWMNSLITFLMIAIYILFIYQAVILNIKRKQANACGEAGRMERKS